MKKAILAVLALASVVACNKSEVLEVAPQKAISFGNPFVDNSTKAPIDPSLTHGTDGTLTEFNVYGVLKNSNNAQTKIFDNVKVTKTQKEATDISGTNTWFYDGDAVQYWIPGNKYTFAALANGTAATYGDDLLPATVSYTANGTTDLLYATSKVDITTGDVDFSSNIAFTFNHLLSKVKFTFANEYSIPGMVLKVTGVTIQNALDGVYAVENDKWTPQTTSDILDFGNILSDDTQNEAEYIAANTSLSSKYERLLVPAAYSGNTALNITYTAEVYIEQEENGSKKYILVDKIEKTAAAPHIPEDAVTLEKGHSYDIIIKIGGALEKIQFDIKDCGGWTPQTPENELN